MTIILDGWAPLSGGVRVWSKETGLGPVGIGLRGFKPHPPHYGQDLLYSGKIVNTLFWMKKEGYPESTLKATSRRLRNLSQFCDLDDPEDVKACIAKKNVSDAYKRNLARAYGYYTKVNGIQWSKPHYKPEKRMPKVPTEEAIERIIARATPRYATVFSILRDTGMMPIELHRTRLRDLDLENGSINAIGCKGHLPRTLTIKPKTLAMLKRYLIKNQGEYPFPTSRRMYEAWRRFRNDLAEKLQDLSIKQIRLYDLRHFYGTMTYHKTKDILYTKMQMGHSKIETTLIYTHLVNFKEDEWTHGVARTLEEACKLVDAGFEYVTEMDGAKIFRKRK